MSVHQAIQTRLSRRGGVDDAQVGYAQGDAAQIDATELPEATRRSLRNRFGANVSSIGVFR